MPAASDPDRLFVKLTGAGARKAQLRAGAAVGLTTIPFARSVDHGGDVELQVELARLAISAGATVCTVKILVFRLPQHDLLGIADGTARAGGTGDQARDDCIEGVSSSLVRGKLRALLRRRLDAKR